MQSSGRRWRTAALLFGLAALLSLGLTACGGDDEGEGEAGFRTVTIQAGQPIKIGISSALSGDLESLGVPIAQGAELAGKDVTIEGFRIEFVRRDDGCSSEGGVTAATQLIQEGVVAVVGPICSSSVVAAQPEYEKTGVTHISPSSTAVVVVEPARGRPFLTFLRIPANDGLQGAAQAKFAYEKLGAKTAYVVHDTDVYGTGLADSFAKEFERLGGRILGREGYEKRTTDFASIVTKIQQANPDVVYHSGFYAEATPFIQQLRRAMPNVKFLSGDGVRDDEFLRGAGRDAEGAYLSQPSPPAPGPEFDAFKKKFQEAYGDDPSDSPFTAEAYDAATVIIEALKKVAQKDGDNLKIDLRKLNETMRKMKFTGASGPVEFGENGDNIGKAGIEISFYVVRNGKFEPVQ